jgi:hypothetical protein
MRTLVAALALVSLVAVGCSDDDSSDSEVSVDSAAAKDYLADLDEAGLGDLFPDDEAAVAYVATACADAEAIGNTPEELIESGAVSEQAAVALEYCDTDLVA